MGGNASKTGIGKEAVPSESEQAAADHEEEVDVRVGVGEEPTSVDDSPHSA